MTKNKLSERSLDMVMDIVDRNAASVQRWKDDLLKAVDDDPWVVVDGVPAIEPADVREYLTQADGAITTLQDARKDLEERVYDLESELEDARAEINESSDLHREATGRLMEGQTPERVLAWMLAEMDGETIPNLARLP